MNILCPVCGATNSYVLVHQGESSTHTLVCVNLISETVRCEALFAIYITGARQDRAMTDRERSELDESDRAWYGGQTFAERAAKLRVVR